MGDKDDPSNWYDFLAPLLLNEEAAGALDDGEYVVQGASGIPLRIRLPETEQQLTSTTEQEPPSLSVDIPDLESEPEYSIPASALGSLIHAGAPGDSVVDHSGRYVTYVPPDGSQNNESEDVSTSDCLPRAVFGSALHKAVELECNPNGKKQLQNLLEQFAVQAEVSVERVEAQDLTELQHHLRVAREYLQELNSGVRIDEQRVQAQLEHGEVYGDIDHLRVTNDTYHIVDYKTNKITDSERLDEKVRQYKWQMCAYAVALHQSDSDKAVQATLLFTEADEARTLEWTSTELQSLETSLDEKIVDALSWPSC